MVGKKVGLLLLFISVGVLSAAEDNTIFKPSYSVPKNSTEKADKIFADISKNIADFFDKVGLSGSVITFFQKKENVQEWADLLHSVEIFVKDQHPKLLPVIDKLKRSSVIIDIVRSENDYDEILARDVSYLIDFCNNFLKQMPLFFKEINTSGYTKFNTTRRARHIVGYTAALIKTIMSKFIKDFEKTPQYRLQQMDPNVMKKGSKIVAERLVQSGKYKKRA